MEPKLIAQLLGHDVPSFRRMKVLLLTVQLTLSNSPAYTETLELTNCRKNPQLGEELGTFALGGGCIRIS